MFRIKNRISGIKFDDKKFLKDRERKLNKLIKEAAREWLIAVLNGIRKAPHTVGDSFPIQTGEAKGSLLPIARILNQSGIGISVPITPAEGRPNRIAIGRSKGHVTLGKTPVRAFYQFEFRTDVLHFQINELNHMPKVVSTTPWRALAKGQRAFEKFIDRNIQKVLPNISEYIFTTEEP